MKSIISTKPAPSFDADGGAPGRRWVLAATLVVPAVLVGGLLFLLLSFRGELEAAVADLARLLPMGYAFAAGMVASVNPCGVLMLPAYLLYQLRTEESGSSAVEQSKQPITYSTRQGKHEDGMGAIPLAAHREKTLHL